MQSGSNRACTNENKTDVSEAWPRISRTACYEYVVCGYIKTLMQPPLSAPRCHIFLQMDALLGGLNDALSRGPAGGYPMAGLTLLVTSATRFGDRTTPGAVRFAAASAVARAAREAGGGLLEPMMEAEVSVPETHVGAVLHDLTANRRAEVRSVVAPSVSMSDGLGGAAATRAGAHRLGVGMGGRHEVRVRVPLRELLGYATTLRSLSGGEASFTMELGGYARMDPDAQKAALEGGW